MFKEPDAPIIIERLRTDELGKTGDEPTNVASHIQHKRGDVEAGFAEADVIVERTFRTETVHQGYIEPQACLASFGEDGQAEFAETSRGPFEGRTGHEVGGGEALLLEGTNGQRFIRLEELDVPNR